MLEVLCTDPCRRVVVCSAGRFDPQAPSTRSGPTVQLHPLFPLSFAPRYHRCLSQEPDTISLPSAIRSFRRVLCLTLILFVGLFAAPPTRTVGPIAVDIDAGHIYWATDVTGTIERVNLEGTDIRVVLTDPDVASDEGFERFEALQVDLEGTPKKI